MPEIESEGWHPGHNPWAVALTVTLATFMEVMDTSIANVALPHIAGGLSAGQDEATWVLTSYLVANAVVLPMSAWLSNRFGRKRFYMTCVALFTASSFLCGLAPNLGSLVFFRILQGAGGGGLGPSEQAILADTFPARKRGMAFAVYGMAVVLAPAIGPTLGGWITDHYSWRWIFYVNVPTGLLSMFLTSFMVQDPPHVKRLQEQARTAPIDFTGIVLVATGLGALQVVLDKGQREDWFHSSMILIFTFMSLAALAVFAIWEWRQEHPILQVRLLKKSNFAVANALMLSLGIALFGSTVLIPQFVQVELGYTAQKAGEVLSPGGFAILLLMPLVGFLVSRVDARILIAGGYIIVALALFGMTHWTLGVDYRTAMLARVFQAMGIAFLFVPINTMSYAGMPPEASNQVSAMINLMRNVGGSIGISLVTTLIVRYSQIHQAYLSARVYAANPKVQHALAGITQHLAARSGQAEASRQAYGLLYAQVARQSRMLAYIDTFRITAIICLVAMLLVFFAKKVKPGKAAMGH